MSKLVFTDPSHGTDTRPTDPADPRSQMCWVSPPLDQQDINPMLHCGKLIGHKGRHAWEKK